ncbi:CDK5 regulatory subunit associated protein 3 [Chamberlinius hualienensis]
MQEENLPIDIHTNKLLDWLISRRHCNRDWSNHVLIIREKINNAIQDMPVHQEISNLLSGSYINYFHCLKIVEILKETESESKNMFGRYSSQRMKDWLEVVSLYEKENVYLAEAANMLMRNVNYEIPALHRQKTKFQLAQQDSEKKSVDLGKQAKELKDKYNSTCRQMGIKGNNIKAEFFELVKDMPSAYESIVNATQKLNNPIEYYAAFAEYTTKKPSKDLLPFLKYLKGEGNTTVYEWRHGKKPISIEEQKLNFDNGTETSNKDAEKIDFGDGNIDCGDSNEIDFGDDSNAIDFGDDNKIDFGNDSNTVDFGEKQISDTLTDGVARGEEALTILDFGSTRNCIINDLCELESFLEQRMSEMQLESDLLSMSQFQSAPSTIQTQTAEKIIEMVANVRNIFNLLDDVKMKQLLIIKESPRFVDRLVDSLNQYLVRSDKMIRQQENVIKKGRDALEEEETLKPKLSLIIQRTKELQKMIEAEISKKYKNRPVNIMGSVNILEQLS